MGVRRRVGARACVRRAAVALVAIIVWLSGAPVPEAQEGGESGARAMQHHATVLNGEVVGSAFAIAEGYVLTNGHVVRGLRPGATLALVASGGGGERIVARLVAVSKRMDLALLAVPEGFLPVVSGTDAPVRSGLPVIAAGIDASGTPGLPRRELAGRVIDPHSEVTAFGPGLVALLPGVRPGFSGGPMLDAEGRLVGMIAAIRPARAAPSAASGFAPVHRGRAVAEEALVLRAPEVRAEARRLLRVERR